MIYLKFTHVDAATGVSVHDEPAIRGPEFPMISGLKFGFALESRYPTDKPVFYGTADDGADLSISGVLERITPERYEADMLAELKTREVRDRAALGEQIASARKRNEVKGFIWSGVRIATDEASQGKIRSEREAAKDGRRKDSDVWKCEDPETGQAAYRVTTNEEMVAIGDAAYFRTQACYAREAQLVAAVQDGIYTPGMLNEGWPE